MCGVEYHFKENGGPHFQIPCARCQADHPCPECGEPIGLYCFLTDTDHTQYLVTIGHTGSNDPPPPCEYISHADTDWLPQVVVHEPVGHLTGPAGNKHLYIQFLDRWEVPDLSENGDEPKSKSLMSWTAETGMPCQIGDDVTWQQRYGPAPRQTLLLRALAASRITSGVDGGPPSYPSSPMVACLRANDGI